MQAKHNEFPDETIHQDLHAAKDLVYSPSLLECTALQEEAESGEYGAYTFALNKLAVKFRVAKITPTKVGQFVVIWKRVGNGPIQPYDVSDQFNFIVISVRRDKDFGQFVFPKSILLEQNVISKNNLGGKRAIRVYPPWDNADSRQAIKTQRWQLNYFLGISSNEPVNIARCRMLFSQK